MKVANVKILHIGKIELRCSEVSRRYQDKVSIHSDAIEHIWNRKQASGGGHLFNGKVLNFSGFDVNADGSISVKGFFINYSEYIAQRANPCINLGITPLGVSALTYFDENTTRYFLVGKRSGEVTQYGGMYEAMPSGSIDDRFLSTDMLIGAEDNLKQEFSEELDIDAEELNIHDSAVFIFDENEQTYDILFFVKITSSSLTINNEYSQILRIAGDDLPVFLENNKSEIAPPTLAAFAAYDNCINKN